MWKRSIEKYKESPRIPKQIESSGLKEKEKERKLPRLGLLKEKAKLQGKKTKVNSDAEQDENGTLGAIKGAENQTKRNLGQDSRKQIMVSEISILLKTVFIHFN